MKIGDLITDNYGTLGIVINQIGIVDRWLVKWIDSGEITPEWGVTLFRL